LDSSARREAALKEAMRQMDGVLRAAEVMIYSQLPHAHLCEQVCFFKSMFLSVGASQESVGESEETVAAAKRKIHRWHSFQAGNFAKLQATCEALAGDVCCSV
jgi:hypothetical protein